MFHKILIANRGRNRSAALSAPAETWRIRSVAVYSKEDQNSLHVQLADQRVCIGEGCLQQLPEYGTHYHSSPQCRC